MTTPPTPGRRRLASSALLAAGVLVLAACGSNNPDTVGTQGNVAPPVPSPFDGLTATESAPPRSTGVDLTQPFGAQVPKATVTGRFVLLPTAPAGYQALAGTASLERSDAGTVLDLTATGLRPSTPLVAVVGTQTCRPSAGGPPFRQDPNGPAGPPNELRVEFSSGADGTGGASASNPSTLPESARSVVLLQAGGGSPEPVKVACADLA